MSRQSYIFDPFVVEYTRNGRVYFLTCRIYIPGVPSILAQEMNSKTVLLRNDVFLYSKNVELSALTSPENDKKIKSDLLLVVNKSLESGQATNILVEGLVK